MLLFVYPSQPEIVCILFLILSLRYQFLFPRINDEKVNA